MSGFYSDDLIEEIKSSNDILDVVSEYVKLKRSGRNYFGLCPFHPEKTPSFSVSTEKQIFHCFGCGIGGNVIHFISKIENLEFVESIKHLADRAKIQLPEGSSEAFNSEKTNLKEQVLKINVEAARYYYNMLTAKQAGIARDYLKNREISGETVRKFGLGFAFGINNDLSKFLLDKGFNEEVILASGLAYKDKRSRLQDKFKARVMFPIFDVRDKVIGFGGRVLDNSLPKYLNSPETIVFNKRKNLYGLNLARKSQERKVVVVEGYMDAISLHQNGLNNVAASLGTSFTQEQGRLLRKYFEEIIIAYDSDQAGQNAAIRGLDLLNDMEIPVRVIRLEDAKDPDEFVRKKGVNSFKDLVNDAKTIGQFKIQVFKEQYDLNDTRGKIEFLNKAAAVLAKVQNSIERDAYIKQISEETGIGVEPIYTEINKLLNGRIKILKTHQNFQTGLIKIRKGIGELSPKILQTEKMLIALLSNEDKRIFELIHQRIQTQDFQAEATRNIAEKIYKLNEKQIDITYSSVLSILENENEISMYTEIMQREFNFEDAFKVACDLIETIARGKLEFKKQEILSKIKNENLSEGDVLELEEELKTITSTLQSLKRN